MITSPQVVYPASGCACGRRQKEQEQYGSADKERRAWSALAPTRTARPRGWAAQKSFMNSTVSAGAGRAPVSPQLQGGH